MTPESSELSSGYQLVIAVAATFASQFVSRLYGNWKAEKEAEKVIISTSSPEQVERLDAKVVDLQKEVAAIQSRLSKMSGPPDDRGPISKP